MAKVSSTASSCLLVSVCHTCSMASGSVGC